MAAFLHNDNTEDCKTTVRLRRGLVLIRMLWTGVRLEHPDQISQRLESGSRFRASDGVSNEV